MCLGALGQEAKQDHGPYVSKNKNAFLEPACRFWCRQEFVEVEDITVSKINK